MKVTGTVTKLEQVDVQPRDILHNMRQEWLRSINMNRDSTIIGGVWVDVVEYSHGHYELIEKEEVRKATESEIQIYNAFGALNKLCQQLY